MADQQTHTLKLPDGRTLAWREYGDPSGFPIVYTHGVFNSRLYQPVWDKTDQITREAGARVLAVDRPGYGKSTFCPTRSYTQWAADVSCLAKSLSLERIGVLGYSSGGPSALACARELPDQVAACVLVSSDCPYYTLDQLGVKGTDDREYLLTMHNTTKPLEHEQAFSNAKMAYEALEHAYASMKNRGRAVVALADLREAAAQGIDKGCTQDGMLETRDWGVEIGEVSVPVLLWHGEDDDEVPVGAGRWLASQIPRCEATFVPGENHTMIRRIWGQMLSAIVNIAQAGGAREARL